MEKLSTQSDVSDPKIWGRNFKTRWQFCQYAVWIGNKIVDYTFKIAELVGIDRLSSATCLQQLY